MRVDRRLVATRTDHRLTWSELAEFVRQHDDKIDPAAQIKAQTGMRGHVRALEIIPDSTREENT